jgi:hypothetical protein
MAALWRNTAVLEAAWGVNFLICRTLRCSKFDEHDLTIYTLACHHTDSSLNHNILTNQDSAHAQEKSCEKEFGQG